MLNRIKFSAALLGTFVLSHGQIAFGADTADQTLNFVVPTVNEISVSGDVTLTVLTPAAGAPFADVTNSLTTYAITTNGVVKKITGSLSAPMDSGLRLFVHLNVPSGTATELPEVEMSGTGAQDLVHAISNVSGANIPIDYRLEATVLAAPGTTSRTMTFTIVDDGSSGGS